MPDNSAEIIAGLRTIASNKHASRRTRREAEEGIRLLSDPQVLKELELGQLLGFSPGDMLQKRIDEAVRKHKRH